MNKFISGALVISFIAFPFTLRAQPSVWEKTAHNQQEIQKELDDAEKEQTIAWQEDIQENSHD